MICYKDRTFCNSDCINKECWRYFGEEQREGAKRWWEGCSGEPPVAFSNFSKSCDSYMKGNDDV